MEKEGGWAHPVRLGALVQILLADGAWIQLPAFVAGEIRQVHARVTLHAVTRIQAKAQPLPTQVAVGAVVDVMLRVVIPQVADVAVICCHYVTALTTLPCTAHYIVLVFCEANQGAIHSVPTLHLVPSICE